MRLLESQANSGCVTVVHVHVLVYELMYDLGSAFDDNTLFPILIYNYRDHSYRCVDEYTLVYTEIYVKLSHTNKHGTTE